MFDLYERRRLRRFFYSNGVLVAMALVVTLLVHGVFNVYSKERETSIKADARRAELLDLLNRQASLAAELGRLETKRGVEEELRGKYNVAKPGEGLIVLVEPPGSATTTSNVSQGVWSWIKSIFN